MRECGNLHARRPDIDAIDGRAVDLGRRVQPLGGGTDELEIRRPLERDIVRNRNFGRIDNKIAVFEASRGRDVQHLAALRPTGCGINIPALCCRRDEHRSCRRASLAHRLPRRAYRVRVARCLDAAQQRIAVKLFVGRSVLHPHLFQVHLQLFGDQHRDGGIGALAHLDIGHGQDDLPVALDANEGVGHEALGGGRFGISVCGRQVQAQHQAAACDRSDLQESAPGEIVS